MKNWVDYPIMHCKEANSKNQTQLIRKKLSLLTTMQHIGEMKKNDHVIFLQSDATQ